MTEYASRGDPKRSMALLWRRTEAARRGPRPALSVDEIVTAAITLADESGLEGVSMRKVAERLGRSAMSLYTYVPGKGELLDLMLDAVLGELLVDDPVRGEGASFRTALEAAARERWAFYERHPWGLQVADARPLLGPNETALHEQDLARLDGLGLNAVEMTRVVAAVGSFVRGAARRFADARVAEAITGLSDDDWWSARAPLLDEMVGGQWQERFPTLARISSERAFDPAPPEAERDLSYTERIALDTFEFGLARLLDGIEAFVQERRREQGG